MMRRFQRFNPDSGDKYNDIWVNDANVLCVAPHGDGKSTITLIGGGLIDVRGWPSDVAKELSGYWDE